MIEPIIKFLKEKIDNPPMVGIVLGSGLQKIASSLDDVLIIQYSDIPSFINTTVDGHAGEFIIGKVNNMNIISCCLQVSELKQELRWHINNGCKVWRPDIDSK